MATGDSVIRVSIIGDVRKLTGALKDADKATSGLLKSTAVSVGATIATLGAIDKGFEFIGDSVQEADRLGDAMARLNAQVGPEFAKDIDDAATGFLKLGLSRQDVDELAAAFADVATATGLSDDKIAEFGVTVAGTAQALSLLGKGDTATLVDQIGKAMGGSEKAAKVLGVTLLDNVDANTQLSNILAQLNPQLLAATTGTADLEQKQAELGARVETLQAQLGEKLAPALADVLQFINDEIDAIPHAIAGWQMLGKVIEDVARSVLSPLARVKDAIDAINNALGQTGVTGSAATAAANRAATRESRTVQSMQDYDERNGGARTVTNRIGGP